MATKEKKTKKPVRKIVVVIVNVLVIFGLVVFGAYYFKKYQDLKEHPVNAAQAAQAEIDHTIDQVGKLYSLPKNEKPQVSSVSDKNLLKGQAFFDKAENGDIALIFVKNKMAILYRPSTNKIINVGNVNVKASPSVKVIGTDTDRASVKKTLTDTYPNDVTVKDESTAKAAYTGVMVVDLTGNNTALASKIATGLKGMVGTLPAGEDKPAGVDILVIAGGAPATTPAP